MDDKDASEYKGPLHQTGLGIHRVLRCRLAKPMTETTTDDVRARLEKIYASGLPLFTKEGIRYAWEQIKREVGYGDKVFKVFTKDISGETVEYDVITGKVKSMGEEDGTEVRYICKELVLAYQARALLLSHSKWRDDCDFKPEYSVLNPVFVCHEGYRMNPKTNEVLLPAPTLDAEFVIKTFQDSVQEWKESQACKKLQSFLSASAKNHEINKTFGFALGGISRKWLEKDGSLRTRDLRRSASQHGLLLTLKEWLQERDGIEEVPCCAQDPCYNSMDKQILGEAGIELIDDPRAWLEVDEQSMMISVAPNVPVKEIIADIARPAVIIWCRVEFNDGLDDPLTDPDSPRVRAMLEGYELHEFAPDQELFSDIVLYTRNSKTAVAPNVNQNITCS